MNCSEAGSKDWWLVVQSTAPIEALQMLNDYKSELLLVTLGSPEYVSTGAKLHKVNAEVKRLNILMNNACWNRACKDVLSDEDYQLVRARIREIEDEYR